MRLIDRHSERFTAKDAFDFAERMATFELQRIDRMHVRFLWFMGSAVTIVLAFLTVLGFVGYNNLRTLAIEAASAQLHVEVAKQIDSKLSSENLPQIVHDEVRSYSAADLRRQVSTEINSGPLHDQILGVSKQQTASLAETLFKQRSLTPDNASRITKAIDADDILSGQPYGFYVNSASPEASHYAEQISGALDDSQLVPLTYYDQAKTIGEPGVAVYCREGSDCSAAQHLATAFSAGGVSVKVIPAPFLSTQPQPGRKDTVIVWIGPNYLR